MISTALGYISGRKKRRQMANATTSPKMVQPTLGSTSTGRFQPGERRVGRKPGVPNKTTAEIKAVAQLYGEEAIEKLVALMRGDNPEVALKAANAILDRGYGKPAQMLQGDPEKPLSVNVTALDAFTRRIAGMAEKVSA